MVGKPFGAGRRRLGRPLRLSAAWAIFSFHSSPPEGGAYNLVLWQWMAAGDFSTNFTLYLDGLSVTMLGVVTGVGS